MANPAGDSVDGPLRLDFDRRLKLEFHGSRITTDGGLLAYRELDDALGLTDMAGDELVDPRTGKNGQHGMTGQFRQSVFGRLGGYEDVNDADRLGRDPAMRWIVGYCGGGAVKRQIEYVIINNAQDEWDVRVTINGETIRAMTACSYFDINQQPPNGFVVALLGEDRSEMLVFREGNKDWLEFGDYTYRKCN